MRPIVVIAIVGACNVPLEHYRSGSGDAHGPGDAQDPESAFAIVPGAKDFGTVPEGMTSSDQVFTIQNQGTVPTSSDIMLAVTGPDAAQFELVAGDTCQLGFQLAPAGTCTASVRFTAMGAGARSAALTVSATIGGIRSADLNAFSLGTTGATCAGDGDCQSGHCTDGVCCDKDASACSGCSACNVAGSLGTCSPVPSGQDPHGACTSLACASGTCDGAGQCAPGMAGTICQNDGCSNWGYVVHTCSGTALGCPSATTTQYCAGNLHCASPVACLTACGVDDDCNGGWCNAGTCTAGAPNGTSCTRARQCASYICDRGKCASCQLGDFGGFYAAYNPLYLNLTPDPICYPTSDGVNDASKTCSQYAASSAACATAGVGDSCVSGTCQCASSTSCTSSAAPNCIADPVRGGNYCGCYYSSGTPHAVYTCYRGEACVGGTCKIAYGYPCGSGSACASGTCTAGYCQ